MNIVTVCPPDHLFKQHGLYISPVRNSISVCACSPICLCGLVTPTVSGLCVSE